MAKKSPESVSDEKAFQESEAIGLQETSAASLPSTAPDTAEAVVTYLAAQTSGSLGGAHGQELLRRATELVQTWAQRDAAIPDA